MIKFFTFQCRKFLHAILWRFKFHLGDTLNPIYIISRSTIFEILVFTETVVGYFPKSIPFFQWKILRFVPSKIVAAIIIRNIHIISICSITWYSYAIIVLCKNFV